MLAKVHLNTWKQQGNIVHPDSTCLPGWPKVSSPLRSDKYRVKEGQKMIHSVKITANIRMVNLDCPLHQK